MTILDSLHREYITDEKGHRKSVVPTIPEFEELLEDLSDLGAIAERCDEPTVSHEDVLAGLKEDGLLPD
jgi:hypothetical protein